MINDSSNGANLYAVGADGRSLGVWPLTSGNYDWEDMASVWINGEPYLLIADIGDNRRARERYRVDIVREPDVLNSLGENEALSRTAVIYYQYPGRSHNAEALATDGEWLYIMTKLSFVLEDYSTNELYRLPLTLFSGEEVLTAEHLGTMPERSQSLQDGVVVANSGPKIFEPTALEISNDNLSAYMLTYSNVFRIQRQQGQTWADVLLTGGLSVHRHGLNQAEALTIADDNSVWFTSENLPAPFWALPPHSP